MAFRDLGPVTLSFPAGYEGYAPAQNFVAPQLFIGDPNVAPPTIPNEGVVVQRDGDSYGFSQFGDVALYTNDATTGAAYLHPRTKNAAGGYIIKCPPFEFAYPKTIFHVPAWLLEPSSSNGPAVVETAACGGGGGNTTPTDPPPTASDITISVCCKPSTSGDTLIDLRTILAGAVGNGLTLLSISAPLYGAANITDEGIVYTVPACGAFTSPPVALPGTVTVVDDGSGDGSDEPITL